MNRNEFDALMKRNGLTVGEAAWTVSKLVIDEMQRKYTSICERHIENAVDDEGQRHLQWLTNEIKKV